MTTCRSCGKEMKPVSFTGPGGKLLTFPPAAYCAADACVAAADAARALETPVKIRQFTDGCPELFKDTDPHRLPPPLNGIALSWSPWNEPKRRGLLIHGATRKGKSRCMWFVRNRLKAEGRYVKVLTMFELEAELVSAWGKDRWDRTMKDMIDVDLLCLDDLGKEKMTERMASVLFALVDQRAQHMRPTLITTNHTSQSLLDRFHDKETGSAFVARLKDRDLFGTVAVAPGADTPEML